MESFKKVLKEEIIVDKDSHLMGAIGVALLSKEAKDENYFNFDIINLKFETCSHECEKCPNHCEIITIKKENKIIDAFGNRCERGINLNNTIH